MEFNVDFLQEYDKGLLLFAIDHYVEHVHPIVFTGDIDYERSEISLINIVKEKVSTSDFIFSEKELSKFDSMTGFFVTELITHKVDSFQDEDKIDSAFQPLKKLGRHLEDLLF